MIVQITLLNFESETSTIIFSYILRESILLKKKFTTSTPQPKF